MTMNDNTEPDFYHTNLHEIDATETVTYLQQVSEWWYFSNWVVKFLRVDLIIHDSNAMECVSSVTSVYKWFTVPF